MKTTSITHTPSMGITDRQKLVNAFCSMDIRPFEKLLDEDLQCSGNKNKYDLIARIKEQFEALKAQGNTELIPVFGRCVGCQEDECGYRFEGNKTETKITYVITEVEEDKFDLSQCRFFHVPGEPKPDMSIPF